MKRKYLQFSLIFFFLIICACDNDDESQEVEVCSVLEDNHFIGYIDGDLKEFVEGEKNYQRYVGGEIEGIDAPKGRFVFGINTWPLNAGDESAFMYTPKINTEDFNEVVAVFPIGELNLWQRKNFRFRYTVLDKVEGHIIRVLEGRFDENSSIEVCSLSLIPNTGSNIFYSVSLEFSCNLYTLDGELKGQLTNGSMTGVIHVYNE